MSPPPPPSRSRSAALSSLTTTTCSRRSPSIIPIQIVDPIPPPFSAFLTLLCLPKAGFEKAQKAGKLPRPKLTAQTVEVGRQLVQKRLEDYPTSLEVRPFPQSCRVALD